MKISLITPWFNSEKTIEDTIKSVLMQDYDNYEHIIIDGKSKDNTLKIIEKYKKDYKGRIKIVSEKDKSLFDAMNKGIRLATGEIIGILNSDDVLDNSHVFKDVVDAMKSDVSIVYSDLDFYNDDLTKVVRTFKTGYGSIFKGWHPPHPTLYLRKEVYEQIGLFNLKYKISADLDLMIRIFKNTDFKSKYLKKNLVKMRAGGVSTNGLKGYIKNFKEAVKVYRDNGISFPVLKNIYRSLKTIRQIHSAKDVSN